MRKLTAEEMNRVSADTFRDLEKLPVVCILDNLRSQHNVGSLFRTADAFRIEELVLCGITATPPNREIQKTALGATESVKWSYFPGTAEVVELLRSKGYLVVAVEQAEGSRMLQDFNPGAQKKMAFVFGNEVHGVSDDVMPLVDACIEIPQFGTKHSFNVSVSAGIVLWQIWMILRS